LVAGIVGLVGCTLKRPIEGNPGSPDPAAGLGSAMESRQISNER
jgi:hypothetical protein